MNYLCIYTTLPPILFENVSKVTGGSPGTRESFSSPVPGFHKAEVDSQKE